ncbi:cytosolic sulfotransferase 18-like [Eutrema salsugineum]|uniref:cytosolic sulfotransferase 18-like n=1 Tax=Eutrema salsugineum TaxID=72664 RepID=UPI000CED7B28|nr:cytosolic sulfotransferase 18-like [Eutrema salsugineum]
MAKHRRFFFGETDMSEYGGNWIVQPLPKDNGPLNTLEESFAMFCRGLSMYSPFLDHVLSYWKAYQENPDQTMFLKYEKMRADPLPYVKRLAEFMGCGFTAEEEKEEAVEKVVNLCSFETLKKHIEGISF